MANENEQKPAGEQEQKKEPVTFSEEQQAYLNGIIDKRLGKAKSKHEEETSTLTAKIAELEAQLAAKPGKPAEQKPAENEGDRAQFKTLLEQEKAQTEAAKKLALELQQKLESTSGEMKTVRRDNAIRDAMAGIESFSFTDANAAKILALSEVNIEFDEEANDYVVKKGNVVLQNSGLQPMSLKEYFTAFASTRPYLVQSRQKGGSGAGESNRFERGGKTFSSKADFTNTKDKVDYITKFGYPAWEALPTK